LVGSSNRPYADATLSLYTGAGDGWNFMATKKTKNNSGRLAVIVTVLILVFVSGYFLLNKNQNPSHSEIDAQVSQKELSPAQREEQLALASRCATDGKVFFDAWLKDLNKNASPLNGHEYSYDGPEYHYSIVLNTCLVYAGTIDISGHSSAHDYTLFDIYSNKPVLYSLTSRTCEVEGCNETVLTSSYDIPSLGTSAFFAQKAQMMKE
jgi:hypothetical protein